MYCPSPEMSNTKSEWNVNCRHGLTLLYRLSDSTHTTLVDRQTTGKAVTAREISLHLPLDFTKKLKLLF